MDIEKKVKIVLSAEDIEQACKAFVREDLAEMDASMMPTFESFSFDFTEDREGSKELTSVTLKYKGT